MKNQTLTQFVVSLYSARTRVIQKSASVLLVLLLLLTSFVWLPAQGTPSQNTDPLPTAPEVLSFINKNISWFRNLSMEQQVATEPEDVVFVNDNRQLATRVVRLSFDFAMAYANTPSLSPRTQQQQGGAAEDRYQSLLRVADSADQQAKQTQAEIEGLRRQLDTAPLRKHKQIESQIAEVQSELELAETRRDTLRNILQFVSGVNGSGGSLRAELEELEKSIPAENNTQGANANPSSASSRRSEATGILGLITDLISISKKLRTIDSRIQQANALQQASSQIRAPFSARMKDLLKNSNDIVQQPDSTDSAVLAQQKQQLDTMTAQFKQVSGIVIPLSKQSILLDLYKRSLGSWRDSVKSDYSTILRNLLIRLGVLVFMLAVIVGLGEIWRRAIFRYVHDVRRRYQFMLLRRVGMWFLIAIVIAFAFASELGSLATFAGLMTAGHRCRIAERNSFRGRLLLSDRQIWRTRRRSRPDFRRHRRGRRHRPRAPAPHGTRDHGNRCSTHRTRRRLLQLRCLPAHCRTL